MLRFRAKRPRNYGASEQENELALPRILHSVQNFCLTLQNLHLLPNRPLFGTILRFAPPFDLRERRGLEIRHHLQNDLQFVEVFRHLTEGL